MLGEEEGEKIKINKTTTKKPPFFIDEDRVSVQRFVKKKSN